MFKEELERVRAQMVEVHDQQELRERLAGPVAEHIEQLELLQGLYEAHMNIGSGSALGLELARRTETGITYVAILPAPDGSSRGRLVPFDERRMYGHETFASPEVALAEALRRGYCETACGSMDRFAATSAWRKSIAESGLVSRYSNREISSVEFHAAMRGIDEESIGTAAV